MLYDDRHSRAELVRLPTLASLEEDLRHALTMGHFGIHWQPIVGCASGNLVGFEALIRWDRPGHGHVPPVAFLPLMERLDLFRRLDRWVLQKACAAAAHWPGHSVAVNISAHWFQGPGLVAAVAEVLEHSGIEPSRLQLEFSETTFFEAQGSAKQDLDWLKSLGVGLSLDDFGAGHTSLGTLHELPFDRLKLDATVVRRLGQCRRTEAVVRAVLQMGRSLGVTMCAKGLERADQLAILQAYGCDEVQGYLIGYPENALPDMLDFYDRLDRTHLFIGTMDIQDAGLSH